MRKLDIAIVILVGLGSLKCFRAGFTRSVWGIAAISTGVFAASQLWPEFAPIPQRFIKHEGFVKWASIIAIATGISFLMDMVFKRLQTIMDRGVLGWINNIAGAAFGGISSSILIGCLLLLLDHYGGEVFREAIAGSRFAPTLRDIGDQVLGLGKEVIKEQVDKM